MSADWAYLSALMPGETVYSWCGAQHTFRAGKSAFESSQGLLGYGHGPRQHDLPAGLSKLPIFQPPYSLRIERVLKQHTVGGYYWPWLSEHARTQVLQDCADGNSTHWRRALVAMSRSRPFQHALRWCPECAETDLAQHGRAYWHVEHQSPIARACRNHRKLLQVIPSPRKTWALVPDALANPRLSPSLDATWGGVSCRGVWLDAISVVPCDSIFNKHVMASSAVGNSKARANA